jgi:putative heme iron utilization protein
MIAAMIICAAISQPDPVVAFVQEVKLATLCTDHNGYPFGSLVGYSVDSEGRPYIFISDLAEHTKNIKKNSKASLVVFKEDKDDLFNSQRLTFVGKITQVKDEKEIEILRKDYLERLPTAEQFIDIEDFNFYRLETEKIHRIGGFGDIEWKTVDEWKEVWRKR